MRFISIYTHAPVSGPPSPEMMQKMGTLVEEGMKAGWLIATEGVHGQGVCLRVSSKQGELSVTDGPFTEAKEVLGGYALIEARDRAHVLELTRKFLAVAGDGSCEIHALYTPPE
ncbi:MAG TPA: YciI family protein [Polyangiaceae bacterium]|nr:YciI family protein [Polyangiaceae bacterium]